MKHALVQLAAVLFAGPGVAQPAPPVDPMAGFYGNTVTVDVPAAGYYVRRYIDPDGTWREPRCSSWIRGAWKIEGGQVCSWQTEPAVHNPHRYCYPIVARQVGDEWVTVDPNTGNEVIQRLEPGRE